MLAFRKNLCCTFFRKRGTLKTPPPALQSVKENWKTVKRFGLHLEAHPCRVVKVYDGDSVTLVWAQDSELVRANCRLYGIDTPEMRGPQKTAAITCKQGLSSAVLNEILLMSTHGASGLDKYGRPLVTLAAGQETSARARSVLGDYKTVNDWILNTLPGCKPYFGGTKGVDENKDDS